MRNAVLNVLLSAVLAAAVGCQAERPTAALEAEYQTVARDPQRDTEAARRCNASALVMIEAGQLKKAQETLKEALQADVFFGPAHNNLGTVYFRQNKHYLAAWEFQYAARLMPNRPEPRNNLGLVFEAVGKLDDAVGWYDKALALTPGCPEIIANLARAMVRKEPKDTKTRRLLEELVMKDSRPRWVNWARQRLALMGPVPAESSETPVPVDPEVLPFPFQPRE